MPERVQRAIVNTVPALAYLPARLPASYHYAADSLSRSGFTIRFRRASDPSHTTSLTFQVETTCTGFGPTAHTFHQDGVAVSWSFGYTEQEQLAWRCLVENHVTFSVSAASIFRDNVLTTPRGRRNALDLVRLVADVKHVS